MVNKNYFQITTAIDYPSGRFHLGHAYEKICTDVIARWKRLQGYTVHFSTGTDCHGLKIQRVSEKANKTPYEFVVEISDGFKELCKILNVSHDDFIMTTEKRHKKVAQFILSELYKNKDIYEGYYEGPYCVDCETYYTEKDLVNGNCPIHKKPVDKIKEESYFFKLSRYQKFLIDYITKNPKCIWPEKKRKEILNRLKEPLKDLSISRKEVKWGIPLPFNKHLTEFVWVEALNNYLTTINYPDKEYKNFWPATHVIGSDIVWHHTAIWFSILKSLNLEMPKVVVHGFINLKGEKLSKAANIRIDPIDLSKTYGTDALRYYLMREIPFGQDGDFSEKSLVNRLNSELADALGNLLSRTAAMIQKYNDNIIPKGTEDKSLSKQLKFKLINEHMENLEFHNALSEIFKYIDLCNKYINDSKPWELAKNKKEKELNNVLFNMAESLRIMAEMLYPFMPETSLRMHEQLGFKHRNTIDLRFGKVKSAGIQKGENLFNKIKEE